MLTFFKYLPQFNHQSLFNFQLEYHCESKLDRTYLIEVITDIKTEVDLKLYFSDLIFVICLLYLIIRNKMQLLEV